MISFSFSFMDDVFVVLNSWAVLGMRGWYLPVINTGIYPHLHASKVSKCSNNWI
jgi:hypothetical protein